MAYALGKGFCVVIAIASMPISISVTFPLCFTIPIGAGIRFFSCSFTRYLLTGEFLASWVRFSIRCRFRKFSIKFALALSPTNIESFLGLGKDCQRLSSKILNLPYCVGTSSVRKLRVSGDLLVRLLTSRTFGISLLELRCGRFFCDRTELLCTRFGGGGENIRWQI